MSIPSVSFSKSRGNGPPRTRATTPTRTRTRAHESSSGYRSRNHGFNPHQTKYQNSNSSDSSDDVPIIPSTDRSHDFINASLESDTNSSSSSPKPIQNANWNFKRTKEAKKESGDDVDDLPSLSKEDRPKRRPGRRAHRSEKVEHEEKPEEKESEEELIVHRKHKTTERSRREVKRDETAITKVKENVEIKVATKLEQKEEIEKPIPKPLDESQAYTVIREKSMFGSLSFIMMANERTVLASSQGKDNLGKVHVICDKKPVSRDSPSFQGFLRVHERGHRFTLVSKDQKPNDDRDGELLGVYFGKGVSGRKMTIVVDKNRRPFFPISKRLNMSRVAKMADEEKNDRFLYYTTEQNQEEDDFGSEFVKKSVKNFIAKDHGETIFQIYRISEDTFNVKCNNPITPMMCFGLAISVIISS